MDFMLRLIEFHGILEDQSYVTAESGRISQILPFLRALFNVSEAHGNLDDLCVPNDLQLDWVLEYPELVQTRQ